MFHPGNPEIPNLENHQPFQEIYVRFPGSMWEKSKQGILRKIHPETFGKSLTANTRCPHHQHGQWTSLEPHEGRDEHVLAICRQILLMEEILHHLGCIKHGKSWDILHISWCRMNIPSTVWIDMAMLWHMGHLSELKTPPQIHWFPIKIQGVLRSWCTWGTCAFVVLQLLLAADHSFLLSTRWAMDPDVGASHDRPRNNMVCRLVSIQAPPPTNG